MLEPDEIVHVIERRRFEGDLRRHFIGTVENVSPTAFRSTGFTFVFDIHTYTYKRTNELRTRIFPMSADGLIINVAAPGTKVENVRYSDINGQLVVTDHAAFTLSVTEFGPRH